MIQVDRLSASFNKKKNRWMCENQKCRSASRWLHRWRRALTIPADGDSDGRHDVHIHSSLVSLLAWWRCAGWGQRQARVQQLPRDDSRTAREADTKPLTHSPPSCQSAPSAPCAAMQLVKSKPLLIQELSPTVDFMLTAAPLCLTYSSLVTIYVAH